MIKQTKSRLGNLIWILMALTLVSCANRPDTKTTGSPSNTNPNEKTASLNANGSRPANLARLDRFGGTWGGYASRSMAVSGKVGIDSKWMKVNVKQLTPDTVQLEGDLWQTKATLKSDPGTEKYLLSFTAEDFPEVAGIPMTFSEANGFSGETTFTDKGKEFKAKATIKDDKGESEWHLNVTQGKDMWNLTIRLGKGQ